MTGAPKARKVSAGPGIQQLREQLEELDHALESYADPVVAAHPGLELMHHTLKERAEHIRSTIEEAETTHLTVTLEGAPLEHGGVQVEALERLLAGCRQAIAALLGDGPPQATDLRVEQVASEAAKVAIRLSGPAGSLDAQPTNGKGQLLLDVALERLLTGLAGKDKEAARAAAPLAKALSDLPVTLTAALEAPTVDESEVTCDAATLELLRANG